MNIIKRAKQVLQIESEAISRLKPRIGKEFAQAVNLILKSRGRVVVSGMGKTGIIAQNFPRRWHPPGRRAFFCIPRKPSMGILAG